MTKLMLFAGDPADVDLAAPTHEVSLATVLRPKMEALLGRSLQAAKFMLWLSPEPAEPRIYGFPFIQNVIPDYGYAVVEVTEGAHVIYRHPHTVREVVGEPLQALLANQFPDIASWGFRIAFAGSDQLVVRSAPAIQGVFTTGAEERTPLWRFGVTKLKAPDPPMARLVGGVEPRLRHGNAPITVLVNRRVFHDLDAQRAFSDRTEEGGFLLGKIYRDADGISEYLIHVMEAPPAKHTGASLLCFTFTGDSFREIKQSLDGERGTQVDLLGWYHTHLFAATDSFGLSSIDIDLHLGTFQQPWQVAGLINIDAERNRRVLRFYGREGVLLTECSAWVASDSVQIELSH